MNRRNYGGNSGVIIDQCRTDGFWFDADELARILTWVRAGGVERPKPEPKPVDTEFDVPYMSSPPRATFLGAVLGFLAGSSNTNWWSD
jgi:hypothetical protein